MVERKQTVSIDGIEVDLYRGTDGKIVVDIIGPDDEKDANDLGEPDIRIWVNEALIYSGGEVGDDLSHTPLNPNDW